MEHVSLASVGPDPDLSTCSRAKLLGPLDQEQYRDSNANLSTVSGFPKVLITCRSELFSGHGYAKYTRSFYPVESRNPDKDEEFEAKTFFQEVRFVEFKNKRMPYQIQHVALLWRDHFHLQFGASDGPVKTTLTRQGARSA